MTSDQVRARVERAIDGRWTRTNLHHVDLREALVHPEKLNFVWADGSPAPTLWLVLRESPAPDNGYVVVYDEQTDEFGLGQIADGYDACCFGLYGDFFDAFEAM
jgi:prepilin-type processing-associated H-X9-DG protein